MEKVRIVKRHFINAAARIGIGCRKCVYRKLGKAISGRGRVGAGANPYVALHTSKHLSELEQLRLTVAKQAKELVRLKKGDWVEGVGERKVYITGGGVTLKSSKS